jgi:hypothetical protein
MDGASRAAAPDLFADHDVAVPLFSPRYALVRELQTWSSRPAALVGSEIDAQEAWLRGLIEQLYRLMALANRPGAITVPDANVLLHYQRFDQVDWRAVLAAEAKVDGVRLVIPMQVLEELDAKKYARRDDFRRRAESVLRALDKFLDQAATGPVKVRPGVTLEILPELPYLLGGQRSSDRDQDGEILADCRFLQQATGRPVTIVTGDRAMRVRARAYGLAVRPMPERYRKPLTSGTDKEDQAEANS